MCILSISVCRILLHGLAAALQTLGKAGSKTSKNDHGYGPKVTTTDTRLDGVSEEGAINIERKYGLLSNMDTWSETLSKLENGVPDKSRSKSPRGAHRELNETIRCPKAALRGTLLDEDHADPANVKNNKTLRNLIPTNGIMAKLTNKPNIPPWTRRALPLHHTTP